MENKGYTLSGLAGRLQKLETAWKSYTALQILAVTKGWKWSVLETKAFGKDKPSSTYRNCRKLAEKVFASAFHAGHRGAVVSLGLDEAMEYTLRVMDAHMTALGVTNQKDYTALAHFVGREDMPEPVAEGKGETPPAESEARAEQNVDVLENIKVAVTALTLEQAEAFAGWLADHINATRAVLELKKAA